MHKKAKDKRQVRSRAYLVDALIELMNEKPYQEITINELAAEAGVSRHTFYRNFRNKDEILISCMDELFDEYFAGIQADVPDRVGQKEIAGRLFRVWKDNRAIFLALQQAGLIHRTLERFSEYTSLIQNQVLKIAETGPHYNTYAADFIAGGTFLILNKWLQQQSAAPVEDLSVFLNEIIQFFVERFPWPGE